MVGVRVRVRVGVGVGVGVRVRVRYFVKKIPQKLLIVGISHRPHHLHEG